MEIWSKVPIATSRARAALLIIAVLFASAACATVPAAQIMATPEEEWLAKQYPKDSVDWDDEQAFVADNSADFGPPARIRANPYVYTYFSSPGDIEKITGGVLIAIVDVDVGTLGTRYSRLQLRQGRNCVWLAREGAPRRWATYVSLANANKECPGHAGSTAFDVYASSPGNAVLEVARFTEDNAGDPLIGFNCGGQWCDVLPAGVSAGKTPANKHSFPVGPDPEWTNQSRHDDEVLAKPSGGPGSPLVKGPRAAIVPVRNLQSLKIKNGDFKNYVPVATVLMQEDPTGTKYANNWGMQLGLNEIQVKFDGTRWWAQTVVGGTVTRQLTIEFHPHDPKYRHAQRARWMWQPNDQIGWIDCDAGCCRVSGT